MKSVIGIEFYIVPGIKLHRADTYFFDVLLSSSKEKIPLWFGRKRNLTK